MTLQTENYHYNVQWRVIYAAVVLNFAYFVGRNSLVAVKVVIVVLAIYWLEPALSQTLTTQTLLASLKKKFTSK